MSKAMGTAIFFLGVGKPLAAREYPLPEELEPEAILVKIRMATVCGSDMHSWRGRRPFPAPAVLGHEGVGSINYAPKHLGMAIDLVMRTQDQHPYKQLASPRFPLTAEGVTEALLTLEQKKAIRPIVVPG